MKTLQIDEARFWALVETARWPLGVSRVDTIAISDLEKIIASLRCFTDSCDNECRYDSGYCSLCDMQFNESKGKRITHPEPE
jgi:hypothetical protein